MQIYVFSKEIFIEAENDEQALREFGLMLAVQRGEFLRPDEWTFTEIPSRDIDQYREIP